MSLETRIVALAQAVGVDIKALYTAIAGLSGGGGLTQGVATLDFGAFPGSNTASVVVTGLTGITASSKPKAYINASATTPDHTSNDHKYLACFVGLACGDIVPATSFTIHAASQEKLQGQWSINYEF
jgi:hypothetical protein